MNEAIQVQEPNVATSVWSVLKRVAATIVILIAAIAFLANAAGLAGIWFVRKPARHTVTALSRFVNDKLGIVEQALIRVADRADQGRQSLGRVNDAASKLGDRLEQNAPLITTLANAVSDDLEPKITEARTQAATLRDGVVSVNAALETLNSLGFITVPTLTDELSAVSERIDSARSNVQELRVTIDQARTGTLQNIVTAVTARTAKIDNGLAQIKSVAVKHQVAIAQKQQQVTNRSQTLLRAINLLVLSLTALFLVIAAGQVLLIYVCWQYVRVGRFPLVHVRRLEDAAPTS